MSKRSLYLVCKTLDEPIRIVGLPLDEFIVTAIISGVFFISGKIILAMVSIVLTIVLLRVMKKGQGGSWLLNICYWYLPSFMSKPILRFTPESHRREWIS